MTERPLARHERELLARITGEERDAILAIRDGPLSTPGELAGKLHAEAIEMIKRTIAPDPGDTERWARTKPREEHGQ